MSNNPYEKIYDELNITITEETTLEEAQQIAKHLGYIYNTFGLIVKDFISMLGYKFRAQIGQNSLNGNKKDKKNIIKDSKNDKKTKLDEKTAQQQLEGKIKTAPHGRIIKQIQNYKYSDRSDLGLQQQLIKTKLLQLRQEKKALQNQSSQIVPKPQSDQQLPQQNSNNPTKISFKKKNTENVVINISSQDQQKEEDDTNGVKTRAQLRGVTRSFLRPQRLLKRGRGKRGRPRKIDRVCRDDEQSSESSEEKSLKGSSYPLDPNDPFTIIYNVPYRPKNNESQSKETIGISMSKKQQKNEKIQQKLRESQPNSLLNSEQEQKKSPKPLQQEKRSNISFYQNINFKKNFIEKVKASYMQEKQAIKERLQNLDKEYKGGKGDENTLSRKKLQLDSDNDEDQYQRMDEQQQFSDHNDHDDQQSVAEQDYRRIQQQNHVQQHQQIKIQKSNQKNSNNNQNISELQRMRDKQIHLQWLNNSIQQQFEQNLRMNDQINEDEYEQEVYLTEQQNEEMSFRGEQPSQSGQNNNVGVQVNGQGEQYEQNVNGDNNISGIDNGVGQQYKEDDYNNNDKLNNQEINNMKIVQQNNNQSNIQINNINISNISNISNIVNNQQHLLIHNNNYYKNEQTQQKKHQQKQQNNSHNVINKNTDQQVLRVLQQFQSDQNQYDHINNHDLDMMVMNHQQQQHEHQQQQKQKNNNNNINNTSQFIPIANFITKKIGQIQKNQQSTSNQQEINSTNYNILPLNQNLSSPKNIKINQNYQQSQNKSLFLNQQSQQIKNLIQPISPMNKDQPIEKKNNSNDYITYSKKTKPIEIIELE